jgi:RNA polymerase sigma factor (sigma-70 family)
MSVPSFNTTQMRDWIVRWQGGDRSAFDELLRQTTARLERLAHKMLAGYPNVRRWADTDDVLQNALMRLARSLKKLQPDSVRAFFGLAAEHLRRELLDLYAHFYGARGLGANQSSVKPGGVEPACEDHDPGELEKWCHFHEEVARLPDDLREVVALIFYHGRTQVEAAELLGVTERTIRRRWQSAMLQLHSSLFEPRDEA